MMTWGDRESLEWRQAEMWAEEARRSESSALTCWAECVTALLCALLGGE